MRPEHSRPEELIITHLPVPPCCIRPSVAMGVGALRGAAGKQRGRPDGHSVGDRQGKRDHSGNHGQRWRYCKHHGLLGVKMPFCCLAAVF
eukprot:767330-Hanusia_phi.AAC.12